ncbi:uncharacterized protein [Montipora foliosa]|uniref:uncharacterized protein n=1 Tax=Montipora foliosa TaxID=591990 RepID=UPI0035F1DA3D
MYLADTLSNAYLSLSPTNTQRSETQKEVESIHAVDSSYLRAAAHIGIQGCLRRAREVVYWPSMNQEITDYIEHCDTRNMYATHPQREPVIVHDVPERPWQKVSDNGPPFDSQEFRDFAAAYEFELVTSSPNYPQSNGRVENAVKTAKQLMKKSKQAGTDFYLTLLDWRNTPTESVGCSPVQRFCGRRTRTLLPTVTRLLKPTTTPGVREKLLRKKEGQTYYYNRGTRELSPLRKDKVRPQHRGLRPRSQVDVRSYAVRTEVGRVFRRSRRHLKKYDPPPATHTPEVEVGPSKITVTSTPPAEGAVKDSEEPPIQPPQLVSADVSTPPSSPTVPAPAPVKDPSAGVAARLHARFKDFKMT